METKVSRHTGGETKGNRHDQLPPPDWQQQQQIFFLYWTIVFFSFSIQLSSLPFSDASVCSHQPWNRRRPKQFSPKDHPAVSLGSFFLVSPSPTGSMRIYKEHEPYVSTQVWWRAFGNHCSSAHPFSFFFFCLLCLLVDNEEQTMRAGISVDDDDQQSASRDRKTPFCCCCCLYVF